jgi:signal transduction histidine kinase
MDVFSVCFTTPYLAVFAGIFIYIGLQHLFVSLVSKQRVLNFSFGLYALSMAGFEIGLIYTLNATNIGDYLFANKILLISFKIAGVMRVVYLTKYANIVYKKIISIYITLIILIITLILFSKTGYLWSEITEIGFKVNCFNETTAYLIGKGSEYLVLDFFTNMLLYIHTFSVIISHYRSNRNNRNVSFTLFLFLIFAALFISQTYCYLKMENNFNTVFFQLGYLIFILVVTFVLLSEFFKFAGLETKLQLQEKYAKNQEEIIYMIVHDLKIPLNALLNLQEKLPKDDIVELINVFTLKLKFQVMDILDIYKTDNYTLSVRKDEYDLNCIIKNAIKNVDFFIRQKNIILVYEPEFRSVICVDRNIIERVVTNLLSNSIKYSQANGFIKVVTSNADVNFVEIKVIDNGIGVEKTKIVNVFDKFAAINLPDNEVVQSTGLGLAFCKMAIEVHGGRIFLDSVVGKGTTVSFTLKL